MAKETEKKDMTTKVSTLDTGSVSKEGSPLIVQVKYPKDYAKPKYMKEGIDYEVSKEGYEILKSKGILK